MPGERGGKRWRKRPMAAAVAAAVARRAGPASAFLSAAPSCPPRHCSRTSLWLPQADAHRALRRRPRMDARNEPDDSIAQARDVAKSRDYEWFMKFIGEDEDGSEPRTPSVAEDKRERREASDGKDVEFLEWPPSNDASTSRTELQRSPMPPQPYYDPEYNLNGVGGSAEAASDFARGSETSQRPQQPRRGSRKDADDGADSDDISRWPRGKAAAEAAAAVPAAAAAVALEPSQLAGLLALGYSKAEAEALSAESVQLLLEMGTVRPKSGVPDDWLAPGPSVRRSSGQSGRRGGRETRAARPAAAAAPPVAKRSGGYYNDIDDEGYDIGAKYTSDDDGIAGYGGDRTPRRQAAPAPAAARRPVDRRRPPPPQPRRRSGYDAMEEAEPLVSWPDLDQFRTMLRQESEMRLGLVGPWAAEIVAAENKFRVQAYSAWLRALRNGDDEGGFDGNDSDDGDSWQYRDRGQAWQGRPPLSSQREGGGGRRRGRESGGRSQSSRDWDDSDDGGFGGFGVGEFLRSSIEALQETLGGLDIELEERDRREGARRRSRGGGGGIGGRAADRGRSGGGSGGGGDGTGSGQRWRPLTPYDDEIDSLSDGDLGLDPYEEPRARSDGGSSRRRGGGGGANSGGEEWSWAPARKAEGRMAVGSGSAGSRRESYLDGGLEGGAEDGVGDNERGGSDGPLDKQWNDRPWDRSDDDGGGTETDSRTKAPGRQRAERPWRDY